MSVLQEVSGCLNCRNALCTRNCPISTQCGQVIALAKENKLEEAQQMLFENNFFSAICSLVCDHHRQCFGHCVLNFKKVPVPFFKLEQELSGPFIKSYHPVVSESKGKSFGIVGCGPSGMTLAFKLACDGYDVTIYDNHEQMGGVLRYGIPDFRLDKSLVDEYQRILQECGVNFVGNTVVDETNVKDIESKHDYLVLAYGSWIGRSLANAKDYDFVYTALDVLDHKIQFDKDSKVIVLGGGNVAMDAVRYSKRQCENTMLYYRKEIKDMPANIDEIEELGKENIPVVELAAPVGFYDKGIIFAKGETVIDENGKKQTVLVENSEYKVECDVAILAISQAVNKSLFKALDLEVNQWGYIDEDNDGLTSKDNVFVIGDALYGPSTVVRCVNNANLLYNRLKERGI